MDNFQRTYSITIQTPQKQTLSINPPLSVSFNVQRNTLSSANKTKVTIYNLGEEIRDIISKDRYNTTEYWQMIIKGGYNGKLSTVFQGNIQEAYSSKEGTEWVTVIDAYDGMYAIQNSYTSTTLSGTTDPKTAIQTIATFLPGIAVGAIGASSLKPTGRAAVYEGPTLEMLTEASGILPFIDNETLHLLQKEEVIAGFFTQLTSDNLLETPKRKEAQLTVRTIFSPQMKVGGLCSLKSKEKRFDGQYKIQGFTHEVGISGASGGRATTTLQLYFGAGELFTQVASQQVTAESVPTS